MKHIDIQQVGSELHIEIDVPLRMNGKETYGDGEWEESAVCIYINDTMSEYGLFHTQYLDYKGALQATSPIVLFDSKEEALDVAARFDLPIEYSLPV